MNDATAALLALALASFAFPATGLAHQPVDDRLRDLERRLAVAPCSPSLHLARAEEERARHNWEAAFAAYDQAARCDPGLGAVALARGLAFLDANRPREAEQELGGFLRRHPDHSAALLARARALARLGQGREAAESFQRAIETASQPRPEHYLEHAMALADVGEDAEALRTLDAGSARLGPLPVLDEAAIDLAVKHGRFDEALSRLRRLAERTPHPEAWLAREGEVSLLAGRPEDARQAFEAALARLAERPQHRRTTPAMRDFERRVRAELERRK